VRCCYKVHSQRCRPVTYDDKDVKDDQKRLSAALHPSHISYRLRVTSYLYRNVTVSINSCSMTLFSLLPRHWITHAYLSWYFNSNCARVPGQGPYAGSLTTTLGDACDRQRHTSWWYLGQDHRWSCLRCCRRSRMERVAIIGRLGAITGCFQEKSKDSSLSTIV